ncbi:unnamed protein product [Brassicogethes aeneus]|uniref:BAT2 N-terminal domain-containing protein n=1 Tax=Brassicogethes aeneus TaxID=1431903 RepID=A0A9P0FJV0_BRAAE|nr:unnamed protein product [Brassicogethes aeneus]
MSTLSGQTSKGEKTKSKYQSLDINNLYRVSRGENTEKTQQKSSSVYIKHGMQSLGKVPSARRAPANLPSLKSEHNETGAAVPLVPPGGPGWGKQESTTSSSSASSTTNSNPTAPNTNNSNNSTNHVTNQPPQNVANSELARPCSFPQSQNDAPPPPSAQSNGGRASVGGRGPPRLADAGEESAPRPIIKEEELSRMDEIGSDMGWAVQDEIDYDQKLAFSDDESDQNKRREHREQQHKQAPQQQQQQQQQNSNRERSDSHSSDGARSWGNARSGGNFRGRSSEEEDIKIQRRTQQEVDMAVQRAKQRKEEEEKRFNEAKQGAAKKLLELEEKIQKRDRVSESSTGSVTKVSVQEFQKEITANDVNVDDKNNFRHLTQIEGKNFPRKHQVAANAKPPPENRGNQQNGLFSRHFQNDLPPRFKNQRNNNNNNSQQQQQQQANYSSNRSEDEDRYKRQSSEDSYRSGGHSETQKTEENLYRETSWHKEKEKKALRHCESGEEKRSRQAVPGPITKERIEADDVKNEKRHVTQLKRGQKPPESVRTREESTAWADAVPTMEDDGIVDEKIQAKKSDCPKDHDADYKARNQQQQQQQQRQASSKGGGWGEYHRSGAPWNKGGRLSAQARTHNKPPSQMSDSDGSLDEHVDGKIKKPDDKNRDAKKSGESYVPRGEPSRIGRGGGGFARASGRMGGMGKKIDGYGPPPKSPFGHHQDNKKDDNPSSVGIDAEDKTKLSQQALSAGMGILPPPPPRGKDGRRVESRRGKSRSKNDEACDELSDEKDGKRNAKLAQRGGNRRSNAPAPRANSDGNNKRYGEVPRQNSNGVKKDELCNAIADITLLKESDEKEKIVGGDCEGFQEVKSKKSTGKERQKSSEKVGGAKGEKEKAATGAKKLTAQQIQNIPSLMATPVNPPQTLPKAQFERPRQQKLAPRFAKQKLQKAQMQQQQQHHLHHHLQHHDDASKGGYGGMKEGAQMGSAWDKPLGSGQMRSQGMVDHDLMGPVAIDGGKPSEAANVQQPAAADKLKSQVQDKSLLDGTTAPVNTIIFENTNFKTAPGSRNCNPPRSEKPRKLDDGNLDASVLSNFNKPLNELIGNDKSDSIQLPMSFKEDNGDMKLDFFDADLSTLTDDKACKNLIVSKMQHVGQSAICTADSLNIKIASVKKVWETAPDRGVAQDDGNVAFSSSFAAPNDGNLDPSCSVFQKADQSDDVGHHEAYNQSPNQTASTTTNVCKVKPTQQVAGGGNPAVLGSGGHQQHSAMVQQGLMGNPLSPPPQMQHVGLGQPQAYGASQHLGYQASLGGSTQYGMSAIPSPPTVPVLYNSSQPLAAAAAAANAAGLYSTFQMEAAGAAGVLGGQGRSQYSQYPAPFGLGQTGSGAYSTQSMYLQTAPPPHAPPPAAQAPPPDMYQNFRLSAAQAPFAAAQNQQLNSPSTVLISSTSNTLMSASVKPSSQQISAIGTKAGGVGQAYQQQSQQGQQVYMYDPSMQANYMSNLQRGPAGPVQNSVVPTLQPSSSYYSGSTGGQSGFFQQPGGSSMASASQLQQHQQGAAAGYGLQGYNQTHTGVNFGSQFLTTPMQMAAALSQQYRTAAAAAGYLKSGGQPQMQQQGQGADQRSLKSPGTQDLSSVFSGSQIPSPKSRQTGKHPPPQSSPTQSKYLYQNMGNPQNNVQRYPAPIQRPVSFQQNLQSNMQKHRSNNVGNKNPRQFYTAQNHSLTSQNDKAEDPKLNDANSNITTSNASNAKPPPAAVKSGPEMKDAIKEESSALKD